MGSDAFLGVHAYLHRNASIQRMGYTLTLSESHSVPFPGRVVEVTWGSRLLCPLLS